MPRQIALRLFLAIAVLLAQQTAIGHQYWHASSSTSLSSEGKKAPKADRLCALHDLLGTVLGVAGASAPELPLLSLSQPGFSPIAPAVREADGVASHSRDPPLIS